VAGAANGAAAATARCAVAAIAHISPGAEPARAAALSWRPLDPASTTTPAAGGSTSGRGSMTMIPYNLHLRASAQKVTREPCAAQAQLHAAQKERRPGEAAAQTSAERAGSW